MTDPFLNLEALKEIELQALSSTPLKVTWHENRSLYLRIDKEMRHLHLHLHRLFLKAPSPVLEALIRYGHKGKIQDRTVLRQMANLYFSTHKVLSAPLQSKGEVYDLRPIFDQINATHFSSQIESQIGWFKIPNYRKFRSITFGTYDRTRGQIRLNRLLDSLQVPLFFVEFIVYHEMLHAVCPPIVGKDGRVLVHTAEFRQREKQFPQFNLVKEWEKSSIQFFKKKVRYGRT